MMSPETIELLKWLIPTGVVPMATWYFTKRHFQSRELKSQDVNIEQNQAETLGRNLKLYQDMIDDLEKRYKEELAERDAKIELVEAKLLEKDAKIERLEARIAELELKHEA